MMMRTKDKETLMEYAYDLRLKQPIKIVYATLHTV